MGEILIYLAVEDDLSESVLRRILRERTVHYVVGPVYKRGGFGYLKKQCGAFNNASKACPILLLTDLDSAECAPGLIKDWLTHPRHPDFLFRVAVREVEAWLLACDLQFASFLGLRKKVDFPDPESLSDPKAALLNLGGASPKRNIREAIARRDKSGTLRQGPAYNSTLAEFVDKDWDLETAAQKCLSLHKLLAALSKLEKRKGQTNQ